MEATTKDNSRQPGVIGQAIYAIGSVLEALLLVRFSLKLFDMQELPGTNALNAATDPIVNIFSEVFQIELNYGQATFEPKTLLAMAALAVVVYLLAGLAYLIEQKT